MSEGLTNGMTIQTKLYKVFGWIGSAASLRPLSPSSYLPDILLLDTGMKDPLVVRDTPDMTKDDIAGESNGSLISQVSWQMTKRIGLLKL